MKQLTDEQFRAFLDLMMCSDPWPVSDRGDGDGHSALLDLANTESRARGYKDWIEAFHRFAPAAA